MSTAEHPERDPNEADQGPRVDPAPVVPPQERQPGERPAQERQPGREPEIVEEAEQLERDGVANTDDDDGDHDD